MAGGDTNLFNGIRVYLEKLNAGFNIKSHNDLETITYTRETMYILTMMMSFILQGEGQKTLELNAHDVKV